MVMPHMAEQAVSMDEKSPLDDFRQLLSRLPDGDEPRRREAEERNRAVARQGGPTGRLGEFAEWLAAWSGRPPQVARPLVALFAGTHETDRLGISARPPSWTQAMVEHCASGGAMISQVCMAQDIGLRLFDLALDVRVADITSAAALDERGAAATIAFGMEAIAGADLLCLGSLGLGGPVSAAAIMCTLKGGRPGDWIGSADDPYAARKRAVVEQAVALHAGAARDALDLMRRLGGRETLAIAGAIVAARMEKIPVILDGFVAASAAAVLDAMQPGAIDHCLLGHVSDEQGHRSAATTLGLRPVLDLELTDGEGVGAALAASLVRTAALVHRGMRVPEG